MNTGRKVRAAAALTAVAMALIAGCAERPESMVNSAKSFLEKNDRPAAIIQLRNALQKNPDLGEARFLLGKALLDNNDFAGAEKELRRASELGYSFDEVTPVLARTLVSKGDSKKAIDDFAKAEVRGAQRIAELQTTLGQAYLALNNIDAAKARFADALKQQPDYAEALLGQARVTAAGGNLPEALSMAETAVAKNEKLAEGWQLKGDLLITQNEVDQAIVAYKKAIEVKPAFLPAHSNLIQIALQQNKVDEAKAQLTAMQKVAGNHPQTLYWEALIAYRQKDFAAAREAIQKQLSRAPDNLPGLVLGGQIHNQLGSYAVAETQLLAALKRSPRQYAARMVLVDTYVKMGQAGKALETLKPMLDDPNGVPSDVLAAAGEVYARNGDARRAAFYFEKAAELDPSSAPKRTAVALSHMATGDGERGFRELEAAAAADTGIRADLALVSALVRQRKYDAALNAMDAIEKKQPNTAFTHTMRGEILVAKRDPAGARASFEKALKVDPVYFPAAAQLARLDINAKKPEDAEKRFNDIVAKDPKNSKALLALAALKLRTGGTTEEVAAMIAKATAANPADAEPRLAMVQHYLAAGDPKKAVAAAQEGLAAFPERTDVMNALGRAQQIAGDTNSAIATYNKMAQVAPESTLAYMRIAELQVESKDVKGAKDSLRKALAIKPDYFEAQRRLVALELDSDAVPAALSIAKDVQKRHPKESIGYMLEGDIYARKKQWDDAINSYKNGFKIVGAPDIAIRLTSALRAGGKDAEADQFTAAFLKQNPGNRTFYSYLAETAMAKKDYPTAVKNYKTLLQTTPNDPVALNNLAWVSHQLKDPKAIEYAERANEISPDTAGILDTLSELLVEKGDVKRAVEMQQRAVALAPDAPQIRLNLARALIKDGQKEAAKKELVVLEKLGDKYPNQAAVAKLMQGL